VEAAPRCRGNRANRARSEPPNPSLLSNGTHGSPPRGLGRERRRKPRRRQADHRLRLPRSGSRPVPRVRRRPRLEPSVRRPPAAGRFDADGWVGSSAVRRGPRLVGARPAAVDGSHERERRRSALRLRRCRPLDPGAAQRDRRRAGDPGERLAGAAGGVRLRLRRGGQPALEARAGTRPSTRTAIRSPTERGSDPDRPRAENLRPRDPYLGREVAHGESGGASGRAAAMDGAGARRGHRDGARGFALRSAGVAGRSRASDRSRAPSSATTAAGSPRRSKRPRSPSCAARARPPRAPGARPSSPRLATCWRSPCS
jgi:hypothetical protein